MVENLLEGGFSINLDKVKPLSAKQRITNFVVSDNCLCLCISVAGPRFLLGMAYQKTDIFFKMSDIGIGSAGGAKQIFLILTIGWKKRICCP